MENASKALIIAGAILLAILLISLGIMIYTQAQDTVQNSGMTQASVTSFNNQFTKYEGDIKGTMVRSMIQEVRAVNADTAENEITIKVNNNPSPVTKKIINNNTYNVTMEYGDDGRINNIVVKTLDSAGNPNENLNVNNSTT